MDVKLALRKQILLNAFEKKVLRRIIVQLKMKITGEYDTTKNCMKFLKNQIYP
jgi:hypothetical protein